MSSSSFYQVISDAVNDLVQHGFDSAARVAYWQRRIREAAEQMLSPAAVMEDQLRKALADIYRRLIDRGQVLELHPGVARFTLEQVKPHLRAELDRRILAAADLIKLHRTQAVEKTLQRFAGWSTSIPAGGAAPGQKREAKENIRKALAQLPFESRRVLIDQGHKLRASLSEIIAKDGHAIAGRWHSHWRQSGYNYRPDHKERDGQVYLLRSTWAQDSGLVKVGPAGYYDQITAAATEPFCRCYMTWLYSLRDLPEEMLTIKGRTDLARVRAEIMAMRSAAA